MKVYQAIRAVQADLASVGIAKNRKNTQGSGYMFRGVDDVYAALAPLLAKHGLCILPRVMSRTVSERTSSKGGALFYTVLTVEFDLVSAEDGTKHTVCTVGEAMDSGDKSTNKAMSAAYKYMAFLTFCIPTEGDNDADGSTHEVKSPQQAFKDYVDAMGTVDSIEGLRNIFTAAYQEFSRDEDAVAKLTDAKNAAKVRLEKAA